MYCVKNKVVSSKKALDGKKWLKEFLSILPRDKKVKLSLIDYKKLLDTEFDEKYANLFAVKNNIAVVRKSRRSTLIK